MCDCANLDDWALIKCLAPPRGEYEVNVMLKNGRTLAINNEGFFLRTKRPESGLPFISTDDTPVSPVELESKGLLDYKEVLCDTLNMLLKASTYGSSYARDKIGECKNLIKKLLEGCA
ncbi:MAG: hypothetical protein F7B59_04675 [Desulfurococcales archaeon]|nr:hypothetical protein [Desulfurococcales archaeon]